MMLILIVVGFIFDLTNAYYSSDDYIVGGVPASIENFPFQVSLRIRGSHFCSGAIISPRHVVTAAHCIQCCVQAPYNDFFVVTGTTYRTSGGQSHRVYSAVTHPYFQTTSVSIKNDIGIITVCCNQRWACTAFWARKTNSRIYGLAV